MMVVMPSRRIFLLPVCGKKTAGNGINDPRRKTLNPIQSCQIFIE
jgi:hypothetical protein